MTSTEPLSIRLEFAVDVESSVTTRHALAITPSPNSEGKLESYKVVYSLNCDDPIYLTVKPQSLEEYIWLFAKSLMLIKPKAIGFVSTIPGFPTITVASTTSIPLKGIEEIKDHMADLVELLEEQSEWPRRNAS